MNSTRPTDIEYRRLGALDRYGIDPGDTGKFDDIVELGRSLTGTSVCLIHILDAYIQWPLARSGKYVRAMPKEESVCQFTIREDRPMEVPDLSRDDRFRLRDYVQGDNGFRFYYGIPLKTPEGVIIGTLCVLDRELVRLTSLQKEQFSLLSRITVARIVRDGTEFRLRETMRRSSKFYKKMNHDVRNPLNGILVTVEMLAGQNNLDSLAIQEDLKLVHRCAEMILEQIDRVMDQGEELTPITAPVTLEELLNKLESLYLPLAQHKEIIFRASAGDTGATTLSEHRVASLLQIVGNLISNAIKSTHRGGEIHLDCTCRNSDSGTPTLEITLRDNGVGMNSPVVEAFNANRDLASHPGTENERGFGVGLRHVRDLTRRENGCIRLESNPGEGSRFTLTLPLKPESADSYV